MYEPGRGEADISKLKRDDIVVDVTRYIREWLKGDVEIQTRVTKGELTS
jgi:hypothetical protein